MRLRNEYTRIKVAFFHWGVIATNSVQTLDLIDSNRAMHILIARKDYALIGEFGSLADRLITIRREAKHLSREH